MRWFKFGSGKSKAPEVDGRQQALVDDVRVRFGPHQPGTFREQADAAVPFMAGDDGILAAAGVLREFADAAHADLWQQAANLSRRTGYAFPVDRANYRPLWRDAEGDLRWPLFELPCRLHPYIHVNAAATVLAGQAKRVSKVTDPYQAIAHVFEILDLTIDGWEFARVRPDTDGATLAHRLIGAGRDLRAALSDEPPLPQCVRELMRRNNTVDVYDPQAPRIVGGFNPGKEMREALLA
ncbi:hypothetical protein [Actinoplanes solisilvae]|uniref:hypothetical protein n=1 Tax=Actinoplanes solisilvae TaxID=2486853 RepID=UPI000FD94241|nr:hypothetical protein [Actinoplanes solisilvae]